MKSAIESNSTFELDMVNISLFKGERDDNGTSFFVVTPKHDASLEFLKTWLQTNRLWIDEQILDHGALLVRGFDIQTAPDVESAIQSYQPELHNKYRGTSPRSVLPGTEYVFSAAEVPTNYPIAQHIEMSFLPEPPKQLFFSCLKPSQSVGGETAVADFRKVYQDIPRDLKQKLLDKGIRYTRTNKKYGTYFTYDVADMVGWPTLFGTNDKKKVEEMCNAENTPFVWKENDTFVSTTYSPAFQLHPVTKEHVWFNHIQVFHWTTFPAELWFAFQRTYEWKLLLQFLVAAIFCVIKYCILGHKMGLEATFGDGEPISVQEACQIRSAIHKNMVFSRWEKGDVLMIDNFSTSHGRQPTFDKGRMVAVAWATPTAKTNEVHSLEPVLTSNKISKEFGTHKQNFVANSKKIPDFSESVNKNCTSSSFLEPRRVMVSPAA